MTEKFCRKCNKICHCPNAEGECTNCECGQREEDSTYKLFLVLALLFALSACSIGKKCTYTQDGTKISSYVWFFSDGKPIDLDKNNCN